MRHSITNTDKQSLMGDCFACGTRVPVYYKPEYRGRKEYFLCKPSKQAYSAAKHKSEYRPKEEVTKRRRLLFNITDIGWESLFTSQGNKCAICPRAEPIGRGWAIDHDHDCCPGRKSCGKCIRGILCQNCNTAIGLMNDDKERMLRAIEYLG